MPKVAIVTGAASGIGKAVIQRCATADISSIILDIDKIGGNKIAAEIRQSGKPATFMQVDVTDENAVQSAFDEITAAHGRIDVLVNVAGGSLHRHPLDKFPLDHWHAVIELNLTSTFLCCRAAAGRMKQQKSGAVVNISSDIGFSGGANRSAYAAAKAGIIGLTKTLALELAPFGVRVNAVAPGRIATPRVRAAYTDAEWETAAKRIPIGRAGEAEDVAEAVAFLAGDAAKHITGQTLHVNGGRIMT